MMVKRFEVQLNSRGAGNIKDLPISIGFKYRNTELLLQFSSITPWCKLAFVESPAERSFL